MTVREFVKLALALLVGAALAFPVGLMIARPNGADDRVVPPQAGGEAAAVRDVFSPSVRTDPWFLERQRQGVEVLEQHCARTGESCAEARAARRRLSDLGAGD